MCHNNTAFYGILSTIIPAPLVAYFSLKFKVIYCVGGVISPTLANLTLDGLEEVVKKAAPGRSRVNCVRYADDFIVTAKSKTMLETMIKSKPAIEKFLSERGLELSEEKTSITHIRKGFTFLGQTFRKTGNKLRITPAKEGVLTLQKKVKEVIRKHRSSPMEGLIKPLNSILRGWGNYHRHVVSSYVFYKIDSYVYNELWRMLKKRHGNKSVKWLFKKYWTVSGKDHVFTVKTKYKEKNRLLTVFQLSSIKIQTFRRIRVKANPYLPEFQLYFRKRRNFKDSKVLGTLSRQAESQLKEVLE